MEFWYHLKLCFYKLVLFNISISRSAGGILTWCGRYMSFGSGPGRLNWGAPPLAPRHCACAPHGSEHPCEQRGCHPDTVLAWSCPFPVFTTGPWTCRGRGRGREREHETSSQRGDSRRTTCAGRVLNHEARKEKEEKPRRFLGRLMGRPMKNYGVGLLVNPSPADQIDWHGFAPAWGLYLSLGIRHPYPNSHP